jgi:hypothetical protein
MAACIQYQKTQGLADAGGLKKLLMIEFAGFDCEKAKWETSSKDKIS